MRTADEILDDELNDNMVEYFKKEPITREWIKDAIYVYAKEYHESEVEKLNLLAVRNRREQLIAFGKHLQPDMDVALIMNDTYVFIAQGN